MENVEIERKFLLRDDSWRKMVVRSYAICQGYLSTDKRRTIRVRQKGDKFFLTIKAMSAKDASSALSRFEWEREISRQDFEALFPLSMPTPIEKVRYIVPWNDVEIEIDEFMGANSGLILAEIEFHSLEQAAEFVTNDSLPSFLALDVSADFRYSNSYLSQRPFAQW